MQHPYFLFADKEFELSNHVLINGINNILYFCVYYEGKNSKHLILCVIYRRFRILSFRFHW
jgi:hypothetical protein